MNLDVATDTMVQLDGDISGVLHDRVGHVGKLYRLTGKVLSADAEEYLRVHEYLDTRTENETEQT